MELRPKHLFTGLLGLCALAGAGIAYEIWAAAREMRTHRAPGKLFLVNGRHVHVHATGDAGPTVVFDAGIGGWSLMWHKVQPAVSTFARTCSFDRPGYGWSQAVRGRRTSAIIVEEMRAMLIAAGFTPPYILVGHSFGGLTMRLFAGLHPDEVVGLVLVDPLNEDTAVHAQAGFHKMLLSEAWRWAVMTVGGKLGVLRLMRNVGRAGGVFPRWTRDESDEVKSLLFNGYIRNALDVAKSEFLDLSRSMAEVAANAPPNGKPIIVLTHGHGEMFATLAPKDAALAEGDWQALQRRLVHESERAELIVATDSGHHIHLDEPTLVVDSIRRMSQKRDV